MKMCSFAKIFSWLNCSSILLRYESCLPYSLPSEYIMLQQRTHYIQIEFVILASKNERKPHMSMGKIYCLWILHNWLKWRIIYAYFHKWATTYTVCELHIEILNWCMQEIGSDPILQIYQTDTQSLLHIKHLSLMIYIQIWTTTF